MPTEIDAILSSLPENQKTTFQRIIKAIDVSDKISIVESLLRWAKAFPQHKIRMTDFVLPFMRTRQALPKEQRVQRWGESHIVILVQTLEWGHKEGLWRWDGSSSLRNTVFDNRSSPTEVEVTRKGWEWLEARDIVVKHAAPVAVQAAINTTVHPIHFEDYSGEQFERLVFAYHLRVEQWRSLEWYGQVGSDLGRDIWGVRESTGSEKVCIQCVNRGKFTAAKAKRDIDKALIAPTGKPAVFRFVCRSNISAKMRDAIKNHAQRQGIHTCEIWSGVEFEEQLRHKAESVLKRFTEGVPFPDAPAELRLFVQDGQPTEFYQA